MNPRATRPGNRRFPLSIMAVGAALPESVSWEILDGNRPGADLYQESADRVTAQQGGNDPVQVLAFTVMPGPQLLSAVPLAKRLKARFPALPIVWGGNFPSLYPDPVLNAPYVDWLVRGQGEQTFVELLDVLAGRRDPERVDGLGFRRPDGSLRNPHASAPWVGPDELPPPPYQRIAGGRLPPPHLPRAAQRRLPGLHRLSVLVPASAA